MSKLTEYVVWNNKLSKIEIGLSGFIFYITLNGFDSDYTYIGEV